METKDIEILLGLREILENQKHYTGKDFKVYNALDQVLNDEEFERLHPRDKDGKFAHTKSSGQTKESNVHKLHIPSAEYKETLKKVEKDNERTIRPDEIINNYLKSSGFDGDKLRKRINEINAEMAYIRDNKKDTQHKYKINGEYTEGRKLKHEQTLKNIFANKESAKPKPGENPTVIFLGGRGGSGKSKFDLPSEENKGGVGVYDRSKYIVLDADEIKNSIDEYKGYNAAEVHEESSDILNMALEKALNEGLNVVLDATMKTKKSTFNKIDKFKESKHNYNIEMYYMHLPLEKAAERALSRFVGKDGKMQGRYVPLNVILNDMKNNEKVFDELKHLASKWAFYNNDVPNKEDKPILIDKNY